MNGSRHFRQENPDYFSLVINVGPNGLIASRGGYVPLFLRKPIATCDLKGGRGPAPTPTLWILPFLSFIDIFLHSAEFSRVHLKM